MPAGSVFPASESIRPVGYSYHWSGDQMIEEAPLYVDGSVAYDQVVHWLYAPGRRIYRFCQENGLMKC